MQAHASAGARVLLVEDDPAIARATIYALEREGYAVTHSVLLRDAARQIEHQPPEAVILDIGLPDGSGLDFCRDLRARSTLPILILSAHGEEIDRILGLELGADDYVTKPFSPRELVARVRGLLRRSRLASASPAASFHPFTVDRTGQRIGLHGVQLALTRLEFLLLLDLLEHKGRIRSRASLLEAVWGADSDSTDRTVDTHVKTLRAKLQEVAPELDCIATHRNMGYSIRLD
jgi:two-component system catabolic regulation response regulator CreB